MVQEVEPFNLEFTVTFAPIKIKKIIVRERVTVVIWEDNTKTRSTCAPDDTFDPVIGIPSVFSRSFMESAR
jgi:hypothetical protein